MGFVESLDEAEASYRSLLHESGLSDCPYNITAFRCAYEAVNMMDAHTPGVEYVFRVFWSDRFGIWLTYICVDLGESCAPVMMVMTAEFIGRSAKMGMELCCGGEGCTHDTCGLIPDAVRKQRSKYMNAPEGVIKDQFAPIVESVDGEMPDYDNLAQFYDVPNDEEEGGP